MTNKAKPLAIEMLVLDPDIQSRKEKLDEDCVDRYAEMYSTTSDAWPFGIDFVKVFYDNENYYVADGFHRTIAAKQAGRTSVLCDLEMGTWQDAFDYSTGPANKTNGLSLTRKDKRHQIEMLLGNEKWANMSSVSIAEHLGFVTDKTVTSVRNSMNVSGSEIPSLYSNDAEDFDDSDQKRTGRDGKNYPSSINVETPDEEEYEEHEPDEDAGEHEDPDPELELPDHLELIREKLLTHFGESELPTSEGHYKAISKLGPDGAIDAVELAREAMTGSDPTLKDYRDAVKRLSSKYAFSIAIQHVEAAMRGIDDCNRHTPHTESHTKAMEAIQSCWETLKGWAK